jgi:hypothetical protein
MSRPPSQWRRPRSRRRFSGRVGVRRVCPLRLQGSGDRRQPVRQARQRQPWRKWNLPAMTYRDANANDLTDFLDRARGGRLAHFSRAATARGAGDNVATLACSKTGPGTIPPPPPPLFRGRHRLVKDHVARFSAAPRRVVLRLHGHAPAAGSYTIVVRRAAGRSFAARSGSADRGSADGGAQLLSCKPRGCGGIGRRAGFRCLCPSGRGGSSPLSRMGARCWACDRVNCGGRAPLTWVRPEAPAAGGRRRCRQPPGRRPAPPP